MIEFGFIIKTKLRQKNLHKNIFWFTWTCWTRNKKNCKLSRLEKQEVHTYVTSTLFFSTCFTSIGPSGRSQARKLIIWARNLWIRLPRMRERLITICNLLLGVHYTVLIIIWSNTRYFFLIPISFLHREHLPKIRLSSLISYVHVHLFTRTRFVFITTTTFLSIFRLN